MRSFHRIPVLVSLLLSAAYAYAQGTGIGTIAGSATTGGRVEISVTAGASFSGIKGAPFSADVIEESDQTLVDGNHIHRETHGRMFRDSEGRTRQENEFPMLMASDEKMVHITIMDPVQKVSITLDARTKVATIRHLEQPSAPVRLEPKQPAAVPSPQARPRKADISQEDLGTMEIEGFMVSGKRMTRTIEAGVIGNDKPLTSVSETWFSRDLNLALLTKTESPQTGRHTRKLVNIHAGDPDPTLFQPPPDYTVKEMQPR